MKYIGTVKWNGDHYFAGEVVTGSRIKFEDGRMWLFDDEQINEIITKINEIKKPKNNEKINDTLEKLLKKRNKLIKYKENLKKLYEEKIDLNNDEHKEMLLSIWKHFKKEEPIDIVDKKWRK